MEDNVVAAAAAQPALSQGAKGSFPTHPKIKENKHT